MKNTIDQSSGLVEVYKDGVKRQNMIIYSKLMDVLARKIPVYME